MKSKKASLLRIPFYIASILFLALVFGLSSQTLADTHYVDPNGSNTPPYTSWATAAHTIQPAIDAASSGDYVEVRPGTSDYVENITMKDGLQVSSDSGIPVIDGVVTFSGPFSSITTLDGFEIKNGGSNGCVYLHGTGTGIDSDTTITDCLIHGSSGPGIKIDGSDATTSPVIDNNTIYSNTEEGIYPVDAGSSSQDAVIRNNTIRDNTEAGVNIAGASYVTIGTNNLIHHNYAGIAFDTGTPGDPSSAPISIKGNKIYSNSYTGIFVKDAITGKVTISEENDIYSNYRGGISIQNSCELDIIRNKIRDNVRGGIHTGTDQANGVGFSGSTGSAVLTIKKNKVYSNGESSYGGGIDVRHASGTIYNNLVHHNFRGGIRFGDYITEIVHNTVADNGESGLGGGIIYDDLAGAVNAEPEGTLTDSPNFPPDPLIRNNISAFNVKTGLRVGNNPSGLTSCPGNPDRDDPNLGDKYRDYNLLYSNNGTGATDCGWDTGEYVRSCVEKNYGACGLTVTIPWTMLDPNDIMAAPSFVNREGDNYQLQGDSPAKNAGDDGTDLGAYGGSDPLVDW